MTPVQWGLVAAGIAFAIFGAIALVQETLSRRATRRAQEELAARKPGECSSHVWRTVVKPYSRQCRRCGALDFREDRDGDIPDGLREYMEAFVRGQIPTAPPPEPNTYPVCGLCHRDVLECQCPKEKSPYTCIHDVNLSDKCDTCETIRRGYEAKKL